MKKLVIASSIITAALLAIATFFDLQIAEYLYNPDSLFSKIFAVIGMLPQQALLIFPPAMILAAMFEKRGEMTVRNWLIISASLLIVTVSNMRDSVNYIRHETGLSILVIIAAVCVLEAACFFAAMPFAKKNPWGLLIAGLIGYIAFALGYVILLALKTFWGRQRFFTMNDPTAQFTKWYIPQGKAASDSFKSFPSGHSFSAMCSVWFALWPLFIDGLKKYTKLIFTFAILFGFATMLSRMIYGRHFLSDVTVGAAIALASFALTKKIICRVFEANVR
ncbi:MAG: phosphatase PAP2 family protein [Spirochaetaceae bacterium]|jgi:membrane-associated phospholipid phosphatase|nr:phosphatase PAP2 family protein [Spirochaetaceae bacterium]